MFRPNYILETVSDNDGGDENRDSSEETNALLSRLRLIEDQPLETRAVAFAQIHEELQSRLDSGDAAPGV
ncbi:MAG: hypothetical protein QOD50_1269 [Actinomycetota bacterium]|jgi:hypothetical protein|nr:hypothetical protein [Actinomycetota bacterium]